MFLERLHLQIFNARFDSDIFFKNKPILNYRSPHFIISEENEDQIPTLLSTPFENLIVCSVVFHLARSKDIFLFYI